MGSKRAGAEGGDRWVEKRARYMRSKTFGFEKIEGSSRQYLIPADRPVRVYCDGIFDLFHYGHMRLLEQAKKLFPSVFLVVGVCSDELTHSMKGRTVMNMEERVESVRHCKWVDEVVPGAPWVIDAEFMKRHDIHYVAHDPVLYMSGGEEDVYAGVKRMGKFIPTRRTEGMSTSGIITRILSSYDDFVKRNLEKGVSARELNISAFTEKRMRVKKKVAKGMEDLKKKMKEFVVVWENTSKGFLHGFIDLFDKNLFGDSGELN